MITDSNGKGQNYVFDHTERPLTTEEYTSDGHSLEHEECKKSLRERGRVEEKKVTKRRTKPKREKEMERKRGDGKSILRH